MTCPSLHVGMAMTTQKTSAVPYPSPALTCFHARAAARELSKRLKSPVRPTRPGREVKTSIRMKLISHKPHACSSAGRFFPDKRMLYRQFSVGLEIRCAMAKRVAGGWEGVANYGFKYYGVGDPSGRFRG